MFVEAGSAAGSSARTHKQINYGSRAAALQPQVSAGLSGVTEGRDCLNANGFWQAVL